jgi:Rps23 Pro-64 3,4-dihydroxylase Tpa1-like proline 4-hydroxylase
VTNETVAIPAWTPTPEVLNELRAAYHGARPWPHVVVKDVFPAELLQQIFAEAQEIDRSQMRVSRTKRHTKLETSARSQLGHATLAMQDFLDGPDFRQTLSAVTGVADLLPDPSHYAAGIHETPQGGKTMIHIDFARHPETKQHHRVNVLLYLNPEWREEWGGQLELWPADMSGVGARIQPTANTMVIWETHGGTLHGLPDPVAAPPGTSRFALAAYYYTEKPAERTVDRAALGTFVARPSDSRLTGLPLPRDLVRAFLPMKLQSILWSLAERVRGRGAGR